MGCIKVGHRHTWPTVGLLVIQRCEIRCNFCKGEAALKPWKYAWFLRRHVRRVHCNKKGGYPDLQVAEDWDDVKIQQTILEMQKKYRGRKIEYVAQPEFEEQKVGSQYHQMSLFPDYNNDFSGIGIPGSGTVNLADIFNGGPLEFMTDPDGVYPALPDEKHAVAINVPFAYEDFETFLRHIEQLCCPEEIEEAILAAKDDATVDGGAIGDATTDDVIMGDTAIEDAEMAGEKDNNIEPALARDGSTVAVAKPGPSTANPAAPRILSQKEYDQGAPCFFFEDDRLYQNKDFDFDGEDDDIPLAEIYHKQSAVQPSLDDFSNMLNILTSNSEGMNADDKVHMIENFATFARAITTNQAPA